MKLRKFIRTYICRNTLVRLHTEIKGGHKELHGIEMEWSPNLRQYDNYEVIGITDIVYSDYREAVNIVVKETTNGNN